MKRIIFFLFLLLFPAPGWATTYYVDYVGGNNGNDGLTEGTAKQTVPTNLVGGDTVYIGAGQSPI